MTFWERWYYVRETVCRQPVYRLQRAVDWRREMTAWIAIEMIEMMGLMNVVANKPFLVPGWCLGVGPFADGGQPSERV